MKKFDTLRFGEIDVDEDKIIHFKEGIHGFEGEKEFLIVPYDEESPFVFLQSLATKELAFLMTSPFIFFPEYEFEIDDAALEHLGIEKQEELLIYSILTIPAGHIQKITANLLAPVVINQSNLFAKQIILEKSQYKTKHRLFPQPEECNKEEA